MLTVNEQTMGCMHYYIDLKIGIIATVGLEIGITATGGQEIVMKSTLNQISWSKKRSPKTSNFFGFR